MYTEYITNGDFETGDLTGWATNGSNPAFVANGYSSYGYSCIIRGLGVSGFDRVGRISQVVTNKLTLGKKYIITVGCYHYIAGPGTLRVLQRDGTIDSFIGSIAPADVAGETDLKFFTFELTPVREFLELELSVLNGGTGEYWVVDNISIQPLVETITGIRRNVTSKMDDFGYYAALERNEGESITNFKAKIQANNTRRPGGNISSLTDAICNEFGLGHSKLVHIISDRDYTLNISGTNLVMSGAGYYELPLIAVNDTGTFKYYTIDNIISGLNNIVGVTASGLSSDYLNLPAILLEEQSSIKQVYNEPIPSVSSFRLGHPLETLPGKVDSTSISFTNNGSFITKVSGSPGALGEWSYTPETNMVKVYSVAASPSTVSYNYNVLGSGYHCYLIGNGAKVMSLMAIDSQALLFKFDGIGEDGKEIARELKVADGHYWGK